MRWECQSSVTSHPSNVLSWSSCRWQRPSKNKKRSRLSSIHPKLWFTGKRIFISEWCHLLRPVYTCFTRQIPIGSSEKLQNEDDGSNNALSWKTDALVGFRISRSLRRDAPCAKFSLEIKRTNVLIIERLREVLAPKSGWRIDRNAIVTRLRYHPRVQ